MYKFIDKYRVERAKPYIKKDDEIIANPPAEMLAELGYKPMMYDDEPIYNEDTEYTIPIYTDCDEYILQGYEIISLEAEVNDNAL